VQGSAKPQAHSNGSVQMFKFQWLQPQLTLSLHLKFCKKSRPCFLGILLISFLPLCHLARNHRQVHVHLLFMTKHIPVDKALREVKHLPSLVQQLMENVNTALCTASETLPSLKGFITAEDHERDIENISQIVPDEKGVASYYDKTIARFCVPLASTLALHPQASSSQWHSLVIWTTSVPCSCYGIMNGLLHLTRNLKGQQSWSAWRVRSVTPSWR
jgi:hypothetical protein